MMTYLVHLNGTIDRRGDYWVARFPQLGPFAYGATREEAKKRAGDIADLVLTHWSRHDVLVERAAAAGLQLEPMDDPNDVPHDTPAGWTSQRLVGV